MSAGQDLVGVVRRKRDLRGAHEVHVVGLEAIDVLSGLAEEAGALHRRGLDQRRRDHRGEPVGGGLGHREVDQGELEQGADAGQVVEARPRHLRAALDVDSAERLSDLEVVADRDALAGEVPDPPVLLEDGEVLLAAARGVRVHEVGDREHELVGTGRGLRALGVSGLHLVGEVLGAGQQRGLVLRGGLGDLLAQALLLVAQRVEAGAGAAPGLVGGQQLIDEPGVLPAGCLGGAEQVRVVAEQAQVDHERSAYAAAQVTRGLLTAPLPSGACQAVDPARG